MTRADLHDRWLDLRARFPAFTPETFAAFLDDAVTRHVYPPTWRLAAWREIDYAARKARGVASAESAS